MAVFVLDKRKRPLMPCSEKRARLLLERGRARVHRLVPFTIRLVDRTVETSVVQPVRIKIDPGSRTTGLALVRESEEVDAETGEVRQAAHVVFLAELSHRGHAIRDAMTARRAFRRRRRSANLRHRACRFANRRKPEGWLAPSLRHRVETTLSWVNRLCRWTPVTAISQELARFDMQAMQHPEIRVRTVSVGAASEAARTYEVREYLLEKWKRKCAYCDTQDVPLEIDHIHPRSKGGSHRVSNLVIACRTCNQKKGNRDVAEFLARDPQRLARIEAQALSPLRDASAVNSTRWALYAALKETGLPVEVGTGGRTKFNRSRLGIPKTHALDAVCVGQVAAVHGWNVLTLGIQCAGRGSYQRTRLNRHGFPRGYLTRSKRHFGFQTGDMVRAVVTTGRKVGTYVGRVAIRAGGSFNLQTKNGLVQGIHHRFCALMQRADGYGYAWSRTAFVKEEAGTGAALSLSALKGGVSRAI
ncbi:RNA-guided endonuclease IscB [Chloracidobacterium aggregatum]|uniref:RRXRR domain-containing protein n=1 Tax=Chloracidobacterium sp. N TaxID=2821540 RepID=A0ABX8B7J2_9BACT|nr:RNA-guided endonuclease IscB [Chloracidobacterium aggregatum]QUV85921.1 RRXRR domain-containing protein [Chloracidobacterium sp. 2]QUV89655.1 RRXRR domain-containing protein [Chloracidobacterium sp. S]QUV92349.1 RRXRR domain-containing protein [Chloracidobacterium sp. A]QUV95625.1 RRXRR domain-containing protein [Chloracidobacterium sp. N]QUV98848.1 RRXRR domain-containing protein [Chloracidobacterium sp. E]